MSRLRPNEAVLDEIPSSPEKALPALAGPIRIEPGDAGRLIVRVPYTPEAGILGLSWSVLPSGRVPGKLLTTPWNRWRISAAAPNSVTVIHRPVYSMVRHCRCKDVRFQKTSWFRS